LTFLHEPSAPSGDALILTHGAGSDCRAPLLVAVAEAFALSGVTVLRMDLAYRELRPHGSPFPAGAAADRESLRRAVEQMRGRVPGRVFLGGHSYGGRQSSMLAAESAGLADGLLLLSYPLHPPRQPLKPRTAHFPQLTTPALFVHGSRDPFGSMEEMREALQLIPARTTLHELPKAGHELLGARVPDLFPIFSGAFQ
jgi:predicted alpha/beta-hydrolase family hydrolase